MKMMVITYLFIPVIYTTFRTSIVFAVGSVLCLCPWYCIFRFLGSDYKPSNVWGTQISTSEL